MRRHLLTCLSILIGLWLLPSFVYAAKPIIVVNSGHHSWMLFSTLLVLFMTIPGLALFYGGLVREKNVLSIVALCFIIAAIMSIMWVLFGFSLSFTSGDLYNKFIGKFSSCLFRDINIFDLIQGPKEAQDRFIFAAYQMGFAIIAPVLIIGGFPERAKLFSIILFVSLWEITVYYPIAHWVWGGGWLQQLGVLDFAGGTAIHINAGMAGLIGALLVGKRKDFLREEIPPHNITLVVTGAGIIWFGWFGFNAGSANNLFQATHIIFTTYLSTASAMLAWMISQRLLLGKISVVGIISGAITGLVAITPACAFVGYIGAVCIGSIAGIFCMILSNIKYKLGYDDSLDAFGVHGVGGVIGCILTGVFAHAALGGIGLSSGVSIYQQVLVQLLSTVVTLAWSAFWSFIILKLIDCTLGLRISDEEEETGLDLSYHGERGYNL